VNAIVKNQYESLQFNETIDPSICLSDDGSKCTVHQDLYQQGVLCGCQQNTLEIRSDSIRFEKVELRVASKLPYSSKLRNAQLFRPLYSATIKLRHS
jgi:hypothetical protein